MKILFTGASSFTGYWFVKKLAMAGHDVTATFTKENKDLYEGIRKTRLDLLPENIKKVYGCRFGDNKFLELTGQSGWDMLCHHAADVTGYKSEEYDIAAGLHNNTFNLQQVLSSLSGSGCKKVLLTGSVFEGGEGAGSEGLKPFSPYGMSKQFTSGVFRYFAAKEGVGLGKFVIPNPFGPYEEARFTAYLVKKWAAGEVPVVNTPLYVRDNIHISLLASVYTRFAESFAEGTEEYIKLSPSGYAESQGAFTSRFACEMRNRLNLACEFGLNDQQEFPEPKIRINTDMAKTLAPDWDEVKAWDELAIYYDKTFLRS